MNLHTQFQEIVLCWLATANKNGIPNVSPKEMFLLKKEHQLIIANIRSPKSIMNIFENPKVCVSGINIFKQKGIQCKGEAKVLSPQDFKFKQLENDFQISQQRALQNSTLYSRQYSRS
jgi:predicted pyridoxine 5'-phosphate oxidase superfamily flavin-nucleotide-binding protein